MSSTALDIRNCSVVRTANTHQVIRMDEQVETQSVTFLSSVCPGGEGHLPLFSVAKILNDRGFTQYIQANNRRIPYFRPRPLLSRSFSILYYPNIRCHTLSPRVLVEQQIHELQINPLAPELLLLFFF